MPATVTHGYVHPPSQMQQRNATEHERPLRANTTICDTRLCQLAQSWQKNTGSERTRATQWITESKNQTQYIAPS